MSEQEQIEYLRQTISRYKRRLFELQRQAAVEGSQRNAATQIQINDTDRDIRRAEVKLSRVEAAVTHASQQTSSQPASNIQSIRDRVATGDQFTAAEMREVLAELDALQARLDDWNRRRMAALGLITAPLDAPIGDAASSQ